MLKSRSGAVVKAIFLTILWTVPLWSVNAKFTCPPSTWPCSCRVDSWGDAEPVLDCDALSNQSQLANYMMEVREANPGSILRIKEFTITDSPRLESIDLTPLTRCNIADLVMFNNDNLRTIVRPAGDDKMIVKNLKIYSMPLSNEEVSHFLSYVDPQTGPEYLNVKEHHIKKVERGAQLIPNLDLYTNLKKLVIGNNQIEELLEGAFKGLGSLQKLGLTGSKIKRLEKGAFQFDLTNKSRSLEMDLTSNELETLPEEVFADLLRPMGPVHKLTVKENQLVCDDRMKWIKSKTITANITGADCTNDKGKDIFNTDLVGDPDAGTTRMTPVSVVTPYSRSSQSFSSHNFVILLNVLHFFARS